MKRIIILLLIGTTISSWAATTINATNNFAYGANIGWLNARGDVTSGAVIGEYVCSGYIWAANVGWIALGSGSPTNGIYYQNLSANDFGVNQDGLGNDSVEGGAIFPFATELPAGWRMGLMTQIDLIRDASGSGYHAEFVNSVTFGHAIVGDLAGYAEFFSAVSSEAGADWTGTVDVGLTYGLTSEIQLDGGVSVGVTRAADDLSTFMGISWRF